MTDPETTLSAEERDVHRPYGDHLPRPGECAQCGGGLVHTESALDYADAARQDSGTAAPTICGDRGATNDRCGLFAGHPGGHHYFDSRLSMTPLSGTAVRGEPFEPYSDDWPREGHEVAPGWRSTALPPATGEGLPVIDTSHDCESCRAQSSEFYDLPGHCLNCRARFMVRSRKGDKPPSAVKCPDCEVREWSWRDYRALASEPGSASGLDVDLTELREIVEAQAEDEGLWFVAQTAPEGYLQQELRRLHAAVEDYVAREYDRLSPTSASTPGDES